MKRKQGLVRQLREPQNNKNRLSGAKNSASHALRIMQTLLSCFPPHRRLCLSCATCSRPLQQHSMAALRISSRNRSIASQRLYTRSALLSLSLPLVSPPWPVPVSSRLLSAFRQAAFVSCLAPPSLRRCLSLFLLLAPRMPLAVVDVLLHFPQSWSQLRRMQQAPAATQHGCLADLLTQTPLSCFPPRLPLEHALSYTNRDASCLV